MPPLIPLARVANIRSVHTLASVHAHWGATSLPCLASGTPGRLSCWYVSFTFPLSYPPWLHGRYSLHRYYGGSDSCPAPSSTKAGILDYRTCISRHSVSNHPMRPRLPAILLVPGGLGPRFALSRYRRFFGFRSVVAVSSVASGRIEFVSRAHDAPVSSTDYLFVSSCSPHPVAGLQLLSTRGGKHHHRGTFTLPCTLSLKRTTAPGPPGAARGEAHAFGEDASRKCYHAAAPGDRARSVRLNPPWAWCVMRG